MGRNKACDRLSYKGMKNGGSHRQLSCGNEKTQCRCEGMKLTEKGVYHKFERKNTIHRIICGP